MTWFFIYCSNLMWQSVFLQDYDVVLFPYLEVFCNIDIFWLVPLPSLLIFLVYSMHHGTLCIEIQTITKFKYFSLSELQWELPISRFLPKAL